MSLAIIAVTMEPKVKIPVKLPLITCGLTTRAIKLSTVVNSTCLSPQESHDDTLNNDMESWWYCTSTELQEAMKDVATDKMNGMNGINGSNTHAEFCQSDPQQEPNTSCNNSILSLPLGPLCHNNGQMILPAFTVNKGQQLVGPSTCSTGHTWRCNY